MIPGLKWGCPARLGATPIARWLVFVREKSHIEMDDEQGYPHLWTPPNECPTATPHGNLLKFLKYHAKLEKEFASQGPRTWGLM